jgi:cysteine-S-conjugate beta-lyase
MVVGRINTMFRRRAPGHLRQPAQTRWPRVLAERDDPAAEVVERHGGRVFPDEVHGPLVYPGSRHVPDASMSDVAAAHTLTATPAWNAWNLRGLMHAEVVLSK